MSGFVPGPFGQPLVYRSIGEWQQLAMSGSLRPDDQLYDLGRGVWHRAGDHPELSPYLPAPPVDWSKVIGLSALTILALAVARASTNDGLRGLGWGDLKREIFRRDSYTCAYCGHRGNVQTLHIDHILPVSRGGADDPENLTTACWSCNLEKGARTGWEYRWWRLFGT